MKFLADMGISLQTVALLQTLGHDVAHLAAQGLEQLPTHDILEKAPPSTVIDPKGMNHHALHN